MQALAGTVRGGSPYGIGESIRNLSFPNSDAFSTDTLATGVSVCKLNDPSNPVIASSSTGPLLGLPCTGGTDNAAKVTATIQSGGVMFSFQGDFANLVLFTEEGNVIRESDGSD